MPSAIEQVHRAFKERGLTVIAIDIQEPPAAVAAWVAARGLSMPVALDESGDVARAWAVTGTPTVFLVDRGGRVVGKAVGNRPWSSAQGRALFAALVGG